MSSILLLTSSPREGQSNPCHERPSAACGQNPGYLGADGVQFGAAKAGCRATSGLNPFPTLS
jgi:hypothetical protein